jgi:hypothetical protein
MPTVRLSENVVFRSFGSETVLLNLTTGNYHGLKGSGGRMLEVLVEQPDLDTAAQRLAEEYGHPVEEVKKDMLELCRTLAERSLLEIEDQGATA